jgi:TRAP-type C4-dicarboxylate transport system substrate-binding protein
MKKRVLVSLVIIILILSVFASCTKTTTAPAPSSTSSAAPASTQTPVKNVVLREAIAHTPQDQIGDESLKMAERFNARVTGYTLEIHHSESLVKFAESLEAVRTGTVELAQWPIDMFGNLDARFNTMGLPFLFNNVDANVAGIDILLPDFSAICEEKFNQKLIGIYTATSLDPLSRKPIRKLDDWKGLLVQTLNPPSSVAVEKLGGSAVSIPWPDAYTSMDKGVVDAVMCSTNQMVVYSFWEVGKYVIPVYIIPTAMTFAVNLDVFNKIPKDVQDILVEEHMKTGKILNDIFVPLTREHLGTLSSHGVEVITPPEEERNKWRDVLSPYTEEALNTVGDFGVRVKAVADEVNAEYPYQTYNP